MSNLSPKFQRQVKSKMWKRWQLFNATDFQSLLYPCFIFSSIFGVFPYKINASIFEPSRSRYFLLIIIVCVTCVYDLIRLYEVNVLNNTKEITEKIQDNFFFMLGSFIIIASSILSGSRMRLLQTILKVSSKLPPKSFEKLSKLIHAKDIFSLFYLMGQSVTSLLHFHQSNELFFATALMEHYINLQILQLNMLYVNCVFILKACFKRIDDNLIILRKFMSEDKSHIPRLIYYHQRNPLLLEELKILRKEHLMVSNTMQMLNKIFSLQLLATFAIAFIEITFEIYSNTVQWKNGLSISLTKQVHNSFVISYLTYHILKVLLIIWSCETGKNQAIKISTTVHDVLNSTSDKNIKYELHLFSLQILHSNNIFSSKFLTVDATFLTAVSNQLHLH
ncbi:hypothetical protein ALC56_12719 [Trachymyrmex septentrionalis]|uniref:Gustatory receptor n=1 Tax=Trachymyrmex septentrionalis TaxID=34720 RepID=A0A195EXF0_9HYME|nr:hypothetical protein ALC56_12719 [Trachymyrmex septentrionalis]